jgi:hypothetical protein
VTKEIVLYLSIFCDADRDDPISKDSRGSEQPVDESNVQTLVSFGFQEDVAIKALKASVRFSFMIYSLYILKSVQNAGVLYTPFTSQFPVQLCMLGPVLV